MAEHTEGELPLGGVVVHVVFLTAHQPDNHHGDEQEDGENGTHTSYYPGLTCRHTQMMTSSPQLIYPIMFHVVTFTRDENRIFVRSTAVIPQNDVIRCIKPPEFAPKTPSQYLQLPPPRRYVPPCVYDSSSRLSVSLHTTGHI